MGNPRRSNGARRSALLEWLRHQCRPCWMCGLPIDYSLPPRHPRSFECDELLPVSKGGSPYSRGNVDAAHRECNGWRGAKSVELVIAIRNSVLAEFGGWSTPEEFVARARAVEKSAKKKLAASSLAVKTTTDW